MSVLVHSYLQFQKRDDHRVERISYCFHSCIIIVCVERRYLLYLRLLTLFLLPLTPVNKLHRTFHQQKSSSQCEMLDGSSFRFSQERITSSSEKEPSTKSFGTVLLARACANLAFSKHSDIIGKTRFDRQLVSDSDRLEYLHNLK